MIITVKSNLRLFLFSLYTNQVINGPRMMSILNIIKKICDTPVALANGWGYQIKKTKAMKVLAIDNDSSRCTNANLFLGVIYCLKFNESFLYYLQIAGAYLACNVPRVAPVIP